MRYTSDNCMAAVLQALPGFQEQWDDHLAAFADEPDDLVLDLAELAAWTLALLDRPDEAAAQPELQAVFTLAEALLTDGDAQVQNAVHSGLLESLLHPLDAGASPPPWWPRLQRLMGPHATAYVTHSLGVGGRAAPLH